MDRPVSPTSWRGPRTGDWSIVLIDRAGGPRLVSLHLRGTDVLCSPRGRDSRAPRAAAGATVTVFDNSPRQLERDASVAAREGLPLRTVLGDMRDLARSPTALRPSVHPSPICSVPSWPVWPNAFACASGGACWRVREPDLYIFDASARPAGEPWCATGFTDHAGSSQEDVTGCRGGRCDRYSHSLTGRSVAVRRRFVLTHITEAPHHPMPRPIPAGLLRHAGRQAARAVALSFAAFGRWGRHGSREGAGAATTVPALRHGVGLCYEFAAPAKPSGARRAGGRRSRVTSTPFPDLGLEGAGLSRSSSRTMSPRSCSNARRSVEAPFLASSSGRAVFQGFNLPAGPCGRTLIHAVESLSCGRIASMRSSRVSMP